MNKLMIMGLGQVGMSLLDIVAETGLFEPSDIFVLDAEPSVERVLLKYGVPSGHFYRKKIESGNYHEIFDCAAYGDYVVDLLNGVDNYLLAEACLERGVHYISTCDDCFDGKFDCFTFRKHFPAYKALKAAYGNCPTSLIEFGMNPGMVSQFSKKALQEIVERDSGAFVSENRAYLLSLVSNREFALLAKELGVRAFVETDNDVTVSCLLPEKNTIYSTWNVPDYDLEINQKAIMKLGTLSLKNDVFEADLQKIYYYNRTDGTLIFNQTALERSFSGYSPAGSFSGCMVSHEEIFSLHDFYTLKNGDGGILYAPSVMFLYKPCDLALQSERDKETAEKTVLIRRENVVSGGEAVGIAVYGERFAPRYVGNYLDIKNVRGETPTVLQVSASVFAALKYVKAHGSLGLLFPEDCLSDEIIGYAKPFFGEIISREI
jgi:homospermidine synthase